MLWLCIWQADPTSASSILVSLLTVREVLNYQTELIIKNKELFENAPPNMDNITLKYKIQLGQILYPIKTKTMYSEDTYNIQ